MAPKPDFVALKMVVKSSGFGMLRDAQGFRRFPHPILTTFSHEIA
jgi:hypothetical protein